MKFTIKRRIQLAFLISTVMSLGIGLMALYYLQALNDEVQKILKRDVDMAVAGEKIKAIYSDIRFFESNYLKDSSDRESYNSWNKHLDEIKSKIQKYSNLFQKMENKARFKTLYMLVEDYGEEFLKLIGNVRRYKSNERKRSMQIIQGLAKRIVRQTEDISKVLWNEFELHRQSTKQISAEAQKWMMIIILLTIMAGILMGVLSPKRVVFPFKALQDAIHDIIDCRLDAKINISGNDEIADIAASFNKMLTTLKEFDDMKIKRIAFESRRFKTMAEMIDVGVMLVSIEGKVLYLNSILYRLFNLSSDDVINKPVEKTDLPGAIQELLVEGLKRKNKITDRKVSVDLSLDQDALQNIDEKILTDEEILAKEEMIKENKIQIDFVSDIHFIPNQEGDVINILCTLEEKSIKSQRSGFALTREGKDESEAEETKKSKKESKKS